MTSMHELSATGMSAEAARAYVAGIAAQSRRMVTEHGGARLVWRLWGDADRPPLVLLHGGHGSWSHWIRNVTTLSDQHAVWVPDMPGYGESDPLTVPVSAGAIAQVLSEGARQLLGDHRPLDLVGFSFGSVCAGHWASQMPSQVGRLVLVGAAGLGLPRLPRGSMMSWRRIADARERVALHRHNLAILMLHDPARIDDLAVYLQTVNSAAARVRSRDLSLGDSLRQLLPRISAPIAGIWGAEDFTARPDLPARGALLRSIQPDAQFHCITNAGHWVQYEDPARFHAALAACLAVPGLVVPGSNPSALP